MSPSQEDLPTSENITEEIEIIENITEGNITEEDSFSENISEGVPLEDLSPSQEDLPISENITEEIEVIENITEEITEEEIPEDVTKISATEIEDASVETIQFQAVLGQPVQWTKIITLNESKPIIVKLPKDATNISVFKLTKELRDELEEIEKEINIQEEASPKEDLSPSQEKLSSETLEELEKRLKELEETLEILEKTLSELSGQLEKINTPFTITGGVIGTQIEKIFEEQNENKKLLEKQINELKETRDGKIPAKFTITTQEILETEEKGFFLFEFFKRIFGTITGFVLQTEEQIDFIEVTIDENETEFEITYETPAPQAIEKLIPRGKQVKISSPEDVHYENVLAFTNLPEAFNIKNPNSVKIHWVEQDIYLPIQNIQDKNKNGIYDYIEWIAPQLSNQTFEIIIITKAEHLDSNRDFISDIFDEVKELDNVWSETIPNRDYVRVTFEQNLTNENDITIYPRIVSGNPKIEVYEFEGTEIIATFDSLNSNEYNIVLLTNLIGIQDTFDLKILNGDVEFDHIIDPPGKLSDDGAIAFAASSIDIGASTTLLSETLLFNNKDSENWDIFIEDTGNNRITDVCGANQIKVIAVTEDRAECTPASTNAAFNDFIDCNTLGADVTISFTVEGCTAGTLTYQFETTTDTGGQDAFTGTATLTVNSAGDSDPPIITIDSPKNKTLGPEVDYVITVNEDLTNALVSIDGGANITMTNDSNTHYFNLSTEHSSLSEGLHNITFFANDTAGNSNTSTEFFTVDATIPNVEFVLPTPANGSTEPSDIYVNISSNDSNDHYAFVDFNGDLFLWMRMDDVNSTGDPTDLSSYGKNGTLNGDAFIISDGIFGKATQFDGVDEASPDSINISGLNTDSRFNESFSFSVWINSREIDVDRDILGTQSSLANGWNLYITNQERIIFQGWNGTADVAVQTAAGFIVADQWFHVVGVYNKSVPDMKIYANGVLRATETTDIPTTGFGNTKDFVIGMTTDSARIWNGSIDEVLLFNRSLSLNEIIALNATKQYEHNFTNLPNAIYTFTGYAVDIGGNKNQTEERTVTIGAVDNFPQWFDNSTNSTIAGTSILHSVRWTDDTALDGYIFSFDNGTGTFVNDSFVSMTGTNNHSNVTKTVNSTIGSIIRWRVYANDSTNQFNNTDIFSYNTTASNSAPIIIFVEAISDQNPSEGGTRTITFNFTAEDLDGAGDLNDSTAESRFQLDGETTRLNTSCVNVGSSGNQVNYSCSIDMWYFDKNDPSWTINVTIQDNAEVSAENSSTTFQYNILTAMVMFPAALSWPSPINVTDTNVGSDNDPIVVNNTGNDINEINITAFDLQGEITTTQYIFAENFTVQNISEGCSGTQMVNATSINVTSATLKRGNNSLNYANATSGQEQLFFCLTAVNVDLSAQSYSSAAYGNWEIKILSVSFLIAVGTKGRGRGKKKKKKKSEENKLIESLDLLEYLHIADKLKEKVHFTDEEIIKTVIDKLSKKYKINREEFLNIIKAREGITIPITIFSEKLGALESIVKYMRETLSMNYREIAKELGRDERTIWTAYKKANEKMKEKIEAEKTSIMIPISRFENKSLTILESIVVYLKEKGMKYSEIAELLGRDQRNVWTIYSRTIKKLNKEKEDEE